MARTHRIHLLRWVLFVPLTLGALVAKPAFAGQSSTVIARDGRALQRVVVARGANPEVRRAAESLASVLGRISGGHFAVEVGDGKRGLVVGTTGDFPEHSGVLALSKTSSRAASKDDYLLRSEPGRLLLLGASPTGARNAVWDLLYRLGYRQFFPGPTWEVVPSKKTLELAVDTVERPSFVMRSIWYGHGFWDYNRDAYDDWVVKNRMGGTIVAIGHTYQRIIRVGAAEFAEHPEWLGLVGGVRKSTKLCVSNPALRAHVVEYALKFFAEHPDQESISMEPSDGGDWCECEACKKLGPPSDRAVFLANEVAAKVRERYPTKEVGMCAYNQHASPPSIRVEPNVDVMVTTAFLPGGSTPDSLLAGWAARGAKLGVYEYLSVNGWDRDAPGRSRAANLDYVRTSIPRYYAEGARLYSGESSDSWGPSGLGYYFASRFLWDVREASRSEALRDDFLTRAFGPAKKPMDAFYRAIDGASKPLPSEDLIARMYRLLDEARALAAKDPAVSKRIEALIEYARYSELLLAYQTPAKEGHQAAFEALIKHAYRMRKTMLMHAKALYLTLPKRDKAVTIPENARWNVPPDKNPWKDERPFSAAEIAAFLQEGKARNRVADFIPERFSRDFLPAQLEKGTLASALSGKDGVTARLRQKFSTEMAPGKDAGKGAPAAEQARPKPICTFGDVSLWVVVPPEASVVGMTVTSGLFGPERSKSKAQLTLAAIEGGERVLASAEVPQDRQPHEVTLAAPGPGVYRVELHDRGTGTFLDWAPGMHVGVEIDPEGPAQFHGPMSLYFYVPRGTKVVGGYAAGIGRVLDAEGKVALDLPAKPGYFKIPVAEGQAGTFWSFDRSAGSRILMTVPPLLFRSPEEAVLPREVLGKASWAN